jgi:RND family efflux transporter MFP subunit
MNHSSRISSVLFYSLFSIAVLTGCSHTEKKETTTAITEKQSPAETFLLQKDRFSNDLQIPGELTAYQQVDLYAKVNGFVKMLNADIGSEVSTGQLLATLEAPEYGAQSSAAASRLKAQEAIYTASNASYSRLLETSKTPGTVSQNDLDLALARKKSDQAQLEAVRSSYNEVNSITNYLQIRAPFSGIISARNVNKGAYVGTAGKGAELPMFTLQEQKRLRLSVAVPEAYAGYLKAGDEVEFKINSMPSETFKASVKRMAGALDTKLRAERIEMDVTNTDKKLLPGMVAEINLHLAGSDSTFVIPKTALVSSAEGTYIIKVVNGTAQKVAVKRGRDNGDKIEIFGNLNDHEVILLKANEEVREGAKIAQLQ